MFFEEEKNIEKYNVFKVFPVNYSVATNQDIFRYLKTDILFQLLEHDLYFEKYDEPFLNTIHTLISEKVINPKNTLVTLSKLYFTLDKSNAHFGKAINFLDTLLNKLRTKQKDFSKNEKKDVLEYLKKVYEDEGSIYEDNLYTQLIRVFLQQIKVDKPNKKNVLIIEDLDRMDPDHVFRILNIISAHFDTYRQKQFETSNKFGFDKIIVVGDLSNLEYLFAHKYGNKVDFSGYINKFYSVEPFKYDNKKAFNAEIDYLFENKRIHNDWYNPLYSTLNILIRGEQISLRDLKNLNHFNFEEIISKVRNYEKKNRVLSNGLFIPIIDLLSKVFLKNQLISKIEICKNKRIDFRNGYYDSSKNTFCLSLLASIGSKVGNYYEYKSGEEIFKFELDIGNNLYETKIVKGSVTFHLNQKIDLLKHNFNLNDFYNLLIENVKMYYQLIENK